VQQFATSKTVTNTDFREEKFRVFMSENEAAILEGAAQSPEPTPAASTEEISYHAVEKDGVVTAIWEMQGRKHLRTIDPRSRQGQDILRLYTTEHHDEIAGEAAAS
jgi:hypothetical protein